MQKRRNGFDLDLIWIYFKKRKFSRNKLARPVMGTIILVCMYVCMSSIVYGKTIKNRML